jgi:hypothetical protein
MLFAWLQFRSSQSETDVNVLLLVPCIQTSSIADTLWISRLPAVRVALIFAVCIVRKDIACT